MLLWHLWASQDPRGFTRSFPALARYPHNLVGGSQLASSHISQTCCSLPSPQPDGLYLPASPYNYSNKQITFSHRNQGSLHSLIIPKPASHSPCWFTLLLSAIPMWPCMVCGICTLLGCEYMWLIHCCQSHLSSVRCHMFCHLVYLGWETSLSPMVGIGSDQNTFAFFVTKYLVYRPKKISERSGSLNKNHRSSLPHGKGKTGQYIY